MNRVGVKTGEFWLLSWGSGGLGASGSVLGAGVASAGISATQYWWRAASLGWRTGAGLRAAWGLGRATVDAVAAAAAAANIVVDVAGAVIAAAAGRWSRRWC